jgi:hypothetical protein
MIYLILIVLLVTPSPRVSAYTNADFSSYMARAPIISRKNVLRWKTTIRHHIEAEDHVIMQPKDYNVRTKISPIYNRRRIRLVSPLRIIKNGNMFKSRQDTKLRISTGFSFDDGDQLLVSAQKPLGMVLEERVRREGDIDFEPGSDIQHHQNYPNGCVVVEVLDGSAAKRAGVKPGDFLVAVQNADVTLSRFEEVMQRISDAPQVVNLRFWRKDWDTTEDESD